MAMPVFYEVALRFSYWEPWIGSAQFLELLVPSWNEAHSVDAQDLALLSQQPTRISFRVQ